MNSLPTSHLSANKDTEKNSMPSGMKCQRIPISQMVRIDSRDPSGRMHAYLHDGPASQHGKKPDLASVRTAIRLRRNPKDTEDITCIQELVREIDRNAHPGLLDIVKNCTYVGVADETFALLQYNTHLYLMNVVNVSKELMYQQAVRKFGKFNAIQLSDPAPLQELLMMALKEEEMDSVSADNDDLKLKIAETNTELLKRKAELLDYCFCIHIDQEGNLSRLPVVLEQYTPEMDYVPEFLLSLGNDVDWENEKECFQTISAAIGSFYAMNPPILPNPSSNGIQFYKRKRAQIDNLGDAGTNSTNLDDVEEDGIDHELLAEAKTAWSQREWTIQHVLFPAMRLFLKPPNVMASNGTFVQVASLEKLYKIFERC